MRSGEFTFEPTRLFNPARRDYQNNVNYYFADHLGTARIVANSSGTPVDDSDFYPFGGERVLTSSSGNRYKFTSKERDSESNLDNFGARHDSSSLGRFMSPDPLLNSGRPSSPQTWNRYAYGRNNPVNLIDPFGLYDFQPTHCAAPQDGGCTQQEIDRGNEERQQFRDALEAIENARFGLTESPLSDPDGQQRLQSILDFYGTEGDHNGVNVGFGAVNGTDDPNAVAQTSRNLKNGSIDITFDTSKFDASSLWSFGGLAVHEGSHGMDIRWPMEGPRLKKFQQEYRADVSRSTFYEGYFLFNTLNTAGTGGPLLNTFTGPLWNSSWLGVDEHTLRDHAVTEFTVQRGRAFAEVQPHDPW